MSTSKHIDSICFLASLLAIALTLLFMNGEALGISVMNGEADGVFAAIDLDADWDTSRATSIVLTGDGGTVTGNGAYIADGNVHIAYAGSYILSGELTDGSVIIDADGDDTVRLLLDGVSLHRSDSAALLIEQADKVILTLGRGTENSISGGETYSDEVSGIDGVIYSCDDLTINGSGALTVTAAYRHGIVCNDTLDITGGTLTVTAVQDGIHANDGVYFATADLAVSAGDDGVTVSNDDATDCFYMESGSITVTDCYEGIEATTVTIAGGTISITPSDDGINAAECIEISGGDIRIVNENGRDADGLDSNGDILISGGRLFISVSDSGGSCAIDYGSENGGTCAVNGGTVVACGSGTMLEAISADSAQAFLTQRVSGAAGANLTLSSADGVEILSETVPCAFSAVTLSSPELTLGDTCTLSVNGAETALTVDNSSVSAFGGMGMGGGHGMFGRQPDWEARQSSVQNDGAGEKPDNIMRQIPAPTDEGRSEISDTTMIGEQMPPMSKEQMSTRPDRGSSDGNTPEMTDVPTRDDRPSDDGNRNQQMNRGDWEIPQQSGEQFKMPEWQDSAPTEHEAQSVPTALPEGTLLLLGISAAVLLAGLIFAKKFRE